MPSTPRGQRTRALIIEQTAAVFDTYGFAGATLNHLVAATGLTRGAFYFHFESKEALAQAIVETQQARWLPIIDELEVSEPDPLARLIRLTARSGLLFTSDVVMRAGSRLMTERALIHRELWQSYPWWTGQVRRLLTEAKDEINDLSHLATDTWPAPTAVPDDVPRGIAAVAEHLVAVWTGIASHAAAAGRADLAERWRAAWMVILTWLCCERARCEELAALVEQLADEMRAATRAAERGAHEAAATRSSMGGTADPVTEAGGAAGPATTREGTPAFDPQPVAPVDETAATLLGRPVPS